MPLKLAGIQIRAHLPGFLRTAEDIFYHPVALRPGDGNPLPDFAVTVCEIHQRPRSK